MPPQNANQNNQSPQSQNSQVRRKCRFVFLCLLGEQEQRSETTFRNCHLAAKGTQTRPF